MMSNKATHYQNEAGEFVPVGQSSNSEIAELKGLIVGLSNRLEAVDNNNEKQAEKTFLDTMAKLGNDGVPAALLQPYKDMAEDTSHVKALARLSNANLSSFAKEGGSKAGKAADANSSEDGSSGPTDEECAAQGAKMLGIPVTAEK